MADENAAVTQSSTTTPAQTPAPSAATGSQSVSAKDVAQSSQSPAGIRDRLTGLGFNASGFKDDDEAFGVIIERLREAHTMREQMQPYLAMAQEYAPNRDKFQQWLAEQQKTAQPATPAEEPDWPVAPQFDPSWIEQATHAEDPLARIDAAKKLQAFKDYQRARLEDLAAKGPVPFVRKELERTVAALRKEMQEEVNKQLEAYKRQQFVDSFALSQADQIFARNEQGQFLTDPTTGQRSFTPYGQFLAQEIEKCERMGMTDPVAVAERAQEIAQLRTQVWMAQQQTQQSAGSETPTAPNVAQQHLTNWIASAAAGKPQNRAGSLTQAGHSNVAQNPNASFAEILRAESRAKGMELDRVT